VFQSQTFVSNECSNNIYGVVLRLRRIVSTVIVLLRLPTLLNDTGHNITSFGHLKTFFLIALVHRPTAH